jgi:hypothetical protein
MANDLATTTRKLTPKQVSELSSFTDPGTILATLDNLGWSINKSLKYLVDIAKNAGKESVRLGAIKYLNQMVVDSMERSGLMIVATIRNRDADGEMVRFTGRILSDSLRNQKECPSTDTQLVEIDPRLAVRKQHEADKETTTDEEETITDDDTLDTCVCKPPEGVHDATGQFGGISVRTTPPDSIDLF